MDLSNVGSMTKVLKLNLVPKALYCVGYPTLPSFEGNMEYCVSLDSISHTCNQWLQRSEVLHESSLGKS